MTPKEFLKTDKATAFENVAFTSEQWNAVYTWMNDFLAHQGQSLPIQNVSNSLPDHVVKFRLEELEMKYNYLMEQFNKMNDC